MPKEAAKRIKFEDHGQDFLWWDIDEDGIVVNCGPFQGFVWIGCKVHGDVEPGEFVLFTSQHTKGLQTITYSVEQIINHEGFQTSERSAENVPSIGNSKPSTPNS